MNDDFELRPVIRELVRTRVCFPDIKLLVDKITIVKLSATNPAATNEAYRLYLTDGDMTIQALVKRRLHKYLNHLNIREGSYLAISDFYSIGEERRDAEESADPGDAEE
ncbi:hypothetical protein OEA41_003816 [Lepraria neglecta]|uniref:Uncharacterized protein n=1 Tax=Lepraria neglecta TaxID=209136 RepID=A0AAE0DIS0_9LECA|nr:hypothetical protein OEA41_003816 [Lepraria neglecta]